MDRTTGHQWMVSFREFVQLQINYLKYSGLWVLDPGSSSFSQSAYLIYKGWMLIAMYIFAITLFADIYDNIDNLSITTDDGCIFSGMFVVVFKVMNYQIRRKKITRFVNDVFECTDDLCQFSNKHAKCIVDKYLFRNKVIFYGFTVLGCVLGVALLFCSPMHNGLPIRAKYPFNTTLPHWHKIGFFIETCAVSGGLVGIIAMDSIKVTISSMITMLLDILNLNFETCSSHIRNDDDKIHIEHVQKKKQRDRKDLDSIFLYRYKDCLRFHQRLVSMNKEYNKIYSSSIFVQMLSSTSIICLTGFQAVVVGEQSSDIMKFGIYMSAAVSQLLYICWIGNELSYSSSVLTRGQWLSDWHHEHLPSIVQIFTLSTMFTRQSITLKAGMFYVLSIETFIAIVRRSYSVYTLLNNLETTKL